MKSVFDNFPQDTPCPVCGTSVKGKGILVPVDNTQTGNREKAVPAHVDCILEYIRMHDTEPLMYVMLTVERS